MAKKNKSQYNPGKYFFAFPRSLSESPDYFNMSHAACNLLHAICNRYNGFNNGNINLTISEMKPIGWNAGTLDRAIHELIDKNWIYVTKQGGKGKHFSCSLYAISFIPLDDIKQKLDCKFKEGYVAREFKKY